MRDRVPMVGIDAAQVLGNEGGRVHKAKKGDLNRPNVFWGNETLHGASGFAGGLFTPVALPRTFKSKNPGIVPTFDQMSPLKWLRSGE